jgi:hypothetical protein
MMDKSMYVIIINGIAANLKITIRKTEIIIKKYLKLLFAKPMVLNFIENKGISEINKYDIPKVMNINTKG